MIGFFTLVFSLLTLLFAPNLRADTYFLYGNEIGEPIRCEGVKLKVILSKDLPELEEDFVPTIPDPEKEDVRIIYDGVCPVGPLRFSAEEDEYLILSFYSQFLYPVVKHDRIIKTQKITVPALKLCSTGNCSPVVSEITLNAPFYENFMVVSFKLKDAFKLKLYQLVSSNSPLKVPVIDDSYLFQAESYDFLLVLKAVDGISDDLPLSVYMLPRSGIKFQVFSLLKDGYVDPLYFCSELDCVTLLSDFTSLMNYFDEKDTRFFTAYISDDTAPPGYFSGLPEDSFFFVLDKNLTDVCVQGDDFYLSPDSGWTAEKNKLSIEAGDYPLGRIRDELRFLASGPHTISILKEDETLVSHNFSIPDSEDNPFLEPKNDPDPASLLSENYQKLFVSLEAESLVINNSVTGRKLGEFDLYLGNPDSQGDRVIRRWCEVYEPRLFEWVKPTLHGFFYVSYQDKNIIDLIGSVLLRCYEKIEREKEDEGGNPITETFVQIIPPPENIDALFTLEDANGTSYSFRARNVTTLGEGTASLWFQNRMYVDSVRKYRTQVRLIVKEATIHSQIYDGKNITLAPSPISIVGIFNERGFRLQNVGTSSDFAALGLDVGVRIKYEKEKENVRIPDLKLLLVISRSNNISLADADSFYEFPFVNGECRRRLVINRTSEDPETVSIRFLAIDRNGVIYPGPVVNRVYVFNLPDPDAPAVLVLSSPEEIHPGDVFDIEAFLNVLSSRPFSYSVKLGFYKQNRGWIWIKDILDGHPVAVFEETSLRKSFYQNKDLKISVKLPDYKDFWTFTILGSYIVYSEVTDVLTGRTVSNTASIVRILP